MAKDKLSKQDFDNLKEALRVSHDKYNIEEKDWVEKFHRYYRGNQWASLDANILSLYGTDRVTDNIIFSNIKTIMPAINFRNPKVLVKAEKKPFPLKTGELFDTIAASIILEIILNYYYKKLETKREVDKCLMDALVTFRGIMFTGYTVKTEKIVKGETIEVNELIRSDSPFTMRISPRDFRVDPEAEDSHLEDGEWIAIRHVDKLSDIKAQSKGSNPKFINVGDLKTNFRVDTDFRNKDKVKKDLGASEGSTKDSKLWDRVEWWALWNKRTQRVVGLVDSHEKEIMNRKWPLDYDGGFPVDVLYFNENPDEALPIADLQIYIDSQDEVNRLLSLQLEHVRRVSQRKFIGRAGAFTAEEKRKITHGGDGVIAEVSEGSVAGALEPLKDATISQDLYITINGRKNAIREESGVSRIESGGAEKFDTATEPALIAQGTENRRDDRTSQLEDFLSHIMRKMGKVLQQTLRKREFPLTNEQFVDAESIIPTKVESIAGPSAKVLMPWITASKDDIQGEYEFSVEVGSTRPINQETRKRDAMGIYNILLQNPIVNQDENIKRLLEAFPEVRGDIDKLLKPADQMAQEQQQAQQGAVQAEIAVDQPKIQADLQKTQMKVAAQNKKTETDAQVSLLTAALKQKEGKGG